METASFMVNLLKLTKTKRKCLSGISDGCLNNDALKHNKGEQLNQTWTTLLKDLKFYEDIDDHTNYLRKKWVLGASESLSGKHGSKVNDQEILGYTDDEWNYIWSTMIKDGAWAVADIKDSTGNVVKLNFAPEMLIKYIAHDLRCHIIVFDLKLNRVQFLSANHIKDNNVAFDSPLLLYSTGSHFQSVFPKNQEYFIEYAKQLENENCYENKKNNEEKNGICSSNGTEAHIEENKDVNQQLFHHEQSPKIMDDISAKVIKLMINSLLITSYVEWTWPLKCTKKDGRPRS